MAGNNSTVLVWSAMANVVAIIAAPAVALWIQRRVDRKKAAESRRQEIFKALWVNRRRPFYLSRIDALNMIDIEFFKEKQVRDSWEDLFAHYRAAPPGLSGPQILQQREEKYSLLLFELSKVLGYNFGKAHIQENIYRPEFHNEYENIDFETKQRILELLKSDALPVRLVTAPEGTHPATTAPVIPGEAATSPPKTN